MSSDTIPNSVRKNNFLLVDTFISKKFSGTDTAELFERNLKTQPEDWYYRHNPVTYTTNSLGYRAPDFNRVDWANSVVIFGCSYVFGIGVDDTDTLPHRLSEILGMPVINMGVSGSSISYSLHNSIMLRDQYPTPKAVVQMWSGYDRTVYYHKKTLNACGPWNLNECEYARVWTDDPSHAETHAIIASKTSKWLWKDTAYFEGSYFSDTARLLECDTVYSVDSARDLIHSGRKTHQQAALQIAKGINL